MKKVLLLMIAFSSYYNITSAQPEDVRKKSMLEQRDNMFFLNNSPYTGEIIDFDGKFDKTKLRFDGHYINGKPNGRIKQWYPNYKLEYEENYIMGEKNGTQYYYYENGKRRAEEPYLNSRLDGKRITYDLNGMRQSEQIIKNGEILSEAFFKNELPDGIWTIYDGNSKNEKGYREGRNTTEANYLNKKLNGRQVIFQDDGSSTVTIYENGEKISEGQLINNKESGKWYYWSDGGQKVIEKTFNEGVLIKEETKIIGNLITNFHSTDNSFLFKTPEKDRALIRFDFKMQDRNEYKEKVVKMIKENMSYSKRLQRIFNVADREYEDESINYVIECSNINVSSETMICKDSKGNQHTAYISTIKVSFVLKSAEGIYRDSKTYESTTKGLLLTTCYNSPQEAFDVANKTDYVAKFIDRNFPVKTFIIGTVDKNSSGIVETVSIEGGTNIGISKNKLNVYDDNEKNVIGLIKVKQIESDFTICKIIEGEERISAKLKSGAKLRVIGVTE